MKNRIEEHIVKAKEILGNALSKSATGNFAYELSADSFSNHVDELTQLLDEQIVLNGTIELISKRERIDLRTFEGQVIRIIYPKKMLYQVTKLHIDQEVTLICQVTKTKNSFTNGSSLSYELIDSQR